MARFGVDGSLAGFKGEVHTTFGKGKTAVFHGGYELLGGLDEVVLRCHVKGKERLAFVCIFVHEAFLIPVV